MLNVTDEPMSDPTTFGDSDPLPFPEPHAEQQTHRWALLADFARDRERAIADKEIR